MLKYFEPPTTHWFMVLELYINCFIYVWLLEHPVTLVTSVTPREPKAQTVSVNISHIGGWDYNTGRFSFTRNLVMRQSSEDLRLNTLIIRSLWDQKIARKSCVYSSTPNPPTPTFLFLSNAEWSIFLLDQLILQRLWDRLFNLLFSQRILRGFIILKCSHHVTEEKITTVNKTFC